MSRTDILAITAVALAATAVLLVLWPAPGVEPAAAPVAGTLEKNKLEKDKLEKDKLEQRLTRLERRLATPGLDRIVHRLDRLSDRLSVRLSAMERLAERIDALEKDRLDDNRLSDLSSDTSDDMAQEWRQDGAGATASDEPTEPPEAAASLPRPRYVAIHTPSKAVTVEQNEKGALFARNTDPEMTMKQIWVEAQRPDGSIVKVLIMVPPPGE